jgi:tellurite resistance protein
VSLRFATVVLLCVIALSGAVGGALAQSPPPIRDVQQALSALGYDIGAIDGRWGPRSRRALIKYQQANGLPPTGELDPATIRSLLPTAPAAPSPSTGPGGAMDAQNRPASPPPDRPSPIDRTLAETVILYRLSHLEVGGCRAADLDPTKTEARFRRQAGDRQTELRRLLEAAATREETGNATIDALYKSKTCAEWRDIGRVFGLTRDVQPSQSSTVVPASPPPQPISNSPSPTSEPAVRPLSSETTGATRRPSTDTGGTALWGGVIVALLIAGYVLRRRRTATSSPLTVMAPPASKIAAPPTGLQPPALPRSDLSKLYEAHKSRLRDVLGSDQVPPSSGLTGDRIAIGSFTPTVELQPTQPQSTAPSQTPVKTTIWPLKPATSGAGRWVTAGESVVVGSRTIKGGLIYLGDRLPRQDNPHENENCLIDPSLPVATRGDLVGQFVDYFPSYAAIPPSSRKAYLDWLDSPRSDPSTYIGYVFLYFYGLERRLMLEGAIDDRHTVLAEVRRLIAVYGEHQSFRRYATALLEADAIRTRGAATEPDLVFEASGYEVPLAVRIALGLRARESRPLDPDMLLSLVMSHPDTRLRTAARRAFTELKALFHIKAHERFPNGIRHTTVPSNLWTPAIYVASTRHFTAPILLPVIKIPDVAADPMLLEAGRALLDGCIDLLDPYSRELGSAPGLAPSLGALAKLPLAIRAARSAEVAADALTTLRSLATLGDPERIDEITARLGLPDRASVNRTRLRDWSAILAAHGYGWTCDPGFALKSAKGDDLAVVFALEAPTDELPEARTAYRISQLALAVAAAVAGADGSVSAEEEAGLRTQAQQSGLPANETRRLTAEAKVYARNPASLADLRARLRDAPVAERTQIGEAVIAAATADGKLDSREVAAVEKIFVVLGLEKSSLYARLHDGLAPAPSPNPLEAPASARPGHTLTGGQTLDRNRLEAIRRETSGTTSILTEIFQDDPPAEPDPPAPLEPAPDNDEDGLDGRHRALIADLIEREQWTRAEFEALVRRAGLMPGAARQALNNWSIDHLDDLLLDGEDPISINRDILPESLMRVTA